VTSSGGSPWSKENDAGTDTGMQQSYSNPPAPGNPPRAATQTLAMHRAPVGWGTGLSWEPLHSPAFSSSNIYH